MSVNDRKEKTIEITQKETFQVQEAQERSKKKEELFIRFQLIPSPQNHTKSI